MSRSKYDNEFKALVLRNNIISQIKAKRKELCPLVPLDMDEDTGEIFKAVFAYSLEWGEYCSRIKKISYGDCALRIMESKRRTTKRIKDKVRAFVLSGNALFVTLTFNEKTLNNTTAEQRRRLVQRYLKSNCKKYVANIDFGKERGREHYHAVCSCDLSFPDWHKYGAIMIEKVDKTEDDNIRVAKYINKLTNHALKMYAVTPRLIYSRNVC